MGGLVVEWLEAGDRLREDGYVIIDGFAGESAARELSAELAALHAGATSSTSPSSPSSEFSRGQVGGGRDGLAMDVRKDDDVRGDERALIDANDPRAPSLRGLFFLCDQLIGLLEARNVLPELRAVRRRSRPMLACYKEGGRYVWHIDNPDGNGRLLTCIYYLNANWREEHGGELVLFPQSRREQKKKKASSTTSSSSREHHRGGGGVVVEPRLDRLVVFWSDARTPHEVLPAHAQRMAVSAWYHTDG